MPARSWLSLELTAGLIRVGEGVLTLVTGIVSIMAAAEPLSLSPVSQYVQYVWIAPVFYVLCAELAGAYEQRALFSVRNALTKVLLGWTCCCASLLLLAFFLKVSGDISRGWVLLYFVVVAACLGAARVIMTIRLHALKVLGQFNDRVAVVGVNSQAERLESYLRQDANLMLDVVGCFDDDEFVDEARIAKTGDLHSLIELIRLGMVEQVVIAMPRSDAALDPVLSRLSVYPIHIRLAPDLASFTTRAQSMVLLGRLPLMTLFERPISGIDLALKRAEDLLLGTIMILVALPFLMLVAAAIKIDSRGPIFFRQEREGYRHETFRIWKFRSMRHELCEDADIRQAQRGDARVTRVGRFIRATSIDELPQLLNVLMGHMSLVGPRPHAPSTRVGAVLFTDAAENYAARHRVKPGMTGWAQVNGWRGETDTDEKLHKRIEHDLFYIDKWSLGFDLYILLRTAGALIFTKAAY